MAAIIAQMICFVLSENWIIFSSDFFVYFTKIIYIYIYIYIYKFSINHRLYTVIHTFNPVLRHLIHKKNALKISGGMFVIFIKWFQKKMIPKENDTVYRRVGWKLIGRKIHMMMS